MRIVSVNIEGSRHLDRVSALLDELDPDVVCLQELFERDRKILADRYSHTTYVAMGIHTQDDHQPAKMGLGFASKTGFEPIKYRYAGPEELHTLDGYDETRLQRWLLGGVIDGVTIVTTHMMVTPDASIMPFQFEDADAIIEFLRDHERVLFCGDLNTHRTGPVFARFAEEFEDTIPADATTSLDLSLHEAAPLYLVVDGAFTRGIEANTELRFGVSDHAALVIETSQ